MEEAMANLSDKLHGGSLGYGVLRHGMLGLLRRSHHRQGRCKPQSWEEPWRGLMMKRGLLEEGEQLRWPPAWMLATGLIMNEAQGMHSYWIAE
jgi:hypothetical protein